ncbi:MAG: GyrI-like domain-containing protein [Alphaproteobacteria bacterium]|nr:GyrI-like domain-containing protein [Alphaproteobacteria bacterium]
MSCSNGAGAEQSYDVRAGLEAFEGFCVAGVSIVTDHERGADDINALWERFFSAQVGQALGERADDVIYAVYSDYEGDYTKPYRVTIGYKVAADVCVPDTLGVVHVQAGDYATMAAQGPQPQSLMSVWEAVWASDLDRSYQTDYEVYGPRFFEDGVHEVLVCIGVNL